MQYETTNNKIRKIYLRSKENKNKLNQRNSNISDIRYKDAIVNATIISLYDSNYIQLQPDAINGMIDTWQTFDALIAPWPPFGLF